MDNTDSENKKPKLDFEEKAFLNGFCDDAPHFTNEELRQAAEPEPEPEKTGLDLDDGLALANTALTVTESSIQKFIHERFHFDEEQAARTAEALAPLIVKYQGTGGEFFAKWGVEIMAAVACLGLTFSSMSIIKNLRIEDIQQQQTPPQQPPQQPQPEPQPEPQELDNNNSSPSKESPLHSNELIDPGQIEDNKKDNAA